MPLPLLSSALRSFLTARGTQFNRDLIDRFIAGDKVEVQVNPREDIGQPIEDRRSRLHDGFNIYAIRYPRNAATDPDWSDPTVGYPFDDYTKEIGSTGFSATGSLWVGFDIDIILGHAPGHGIEQFEVDRIDHECVAVPYIELRRSTRGFGRHLYVRVTGFDTANHTEHNALARAVLGKLCHDTGYAFAPRIDCLGGNLWFWSRRATEENRGFECLHESTQVLTPADVPDWRAHIEVVQRKQTKVKVSGLDDEDAASYPTVRKDIEHDRIFAEYKRLGYSLIYQPDHGCYQLHTGGLAKTHKTLGLRGAFATNSADTDPGKPNAFAFLRSNGGLLVVRFESKDEHPLWSKTAKGQPCIGYNVSLDPKAACRSVNAVWASSSSFTCSTFAAATAAAKLFGVNLPELSERSVNFIFKGSGVTIEADRRGKESPEGWGTKGRKLSAYHEIDAPPADSEHDNVVRHIVSPSREDAGWIVRRDDGEWGFESKDNIFDALVSHGHGEDIPGIFGSCVRKPWTLVNEPFGAEFLSGRRWNRNAKRLIVPTQTGTLSHNHYDLILSHNGEGLDEVVADHPWCAQHGIKCGADYLRMWAASLVQRPKHPLPYLFFWSERNNTGKSSLHRALSFLIEGDDGATDVHLALSEKFNGDMAGCVLGFIEDKGLNAAGYERLKSWVDAPTIKIREMRTNAYTLPNYGHFIHTANRLTACPVQPHDERVVVIPVAPPFHDIPWQTKMAPALQREAPDFLATLLAVPLPPDFGRLFLPVLDTESKCELMRLHSEDAETTDNRRVVVDALVTAIVKLVTRVEYWRGTAGTLRNAIGSGPWSDSPGTLANYLIDTMTPLQQQEIIVSIASTQVNGQREINIGRPWLVEPTWSDDELADDAMRVADLQG